MKKLSCLIIEDETILADVLVEYIDQIPFLDLKKVFHDGLSAVEYLEQHSVDIIFIDVNLPLLKGIDFIRMFPSKAKYIITTAYHEYAIEGYELNVVDYLMKPIEFNRFLMAVKKVLPKENEEGIAEKISNNYFFINMNKRRVKVNFSEILYIEGLKEYVKIYTAKDKWLITKLQMGQVQHLLNRDFVRIHRSYIVSRKRITSYNQTEVNIENIALPVGTNYKELLCSLLEG